MADRDRVLAFVTDVYGMLDMLVERRQEYFPAAFGDLIRDAWQEVAEQRGRVRDAVGSISDKQLASVGLTGRQLDLKLAIFDDWKKRFLESGGKRFLKKLLDWIDKILASISIVQPLVHALIEFKQSLESLLDEETPGA